MATATSSARVVIPARAIHPNTWFSHKALILDPLESRAIDVTGQFIVITEADRAFNLSIDDGEAFDCNLGFKFRLSAGDWFTRLTFTSTDDDEQSLIEFYTGAGDIDDQRLNLVRDRPGQMMLQEFPSLWKPSGLDHIDALDEEFFPGTGTVGSGYGRRKELVITNLDPSLDLEIYKATVAGVKDGRVATALYRQILGFHTDDHMIVRNENGSDVNVRIAELFYPEG
jgi:hypothetical protein